MRRMIVIPVVLFLFAMQANYFLFANEDAEAETEVGIDAAEVNTDESTATVSEISESAEAVVEKGAEATANKVTPVVAVEEKENDVIAMVNGEKILRITFDKRLNVFRRMDQEVTDAIKMQVVDQLIKKNVVEAIC
ncbi:MAG: putative peptidyl-prolyl cis-trans isomerase [Candidatus Scalindua brodae]|uniref:Putative peptidyl-prolyl cis-trans isomerase n=1 Tax=Candidatus Scalindua brodae TaxID=237368 RepID=A0A0B0EHG1_9BACT|nr:MAG: putative peptidyl-prolyl cis-trans isomerase [Candidatus Scalindua brodae]